MDTPVTHSRKATRCVRLHIARKCTSTWSVLRLKPSIPAPASATTKLSTFAVAIHVLFLCERVRHSCITNVPLAVSPNRQSTYVSLSRGCRDWSRPPAWIVYNVAIVLRRWCMALADWLAPPPLLLAEKATAYAQSQVHSHLAVCPSGLAAFLGVCCYTLARRRR
jgi:hypothetical protein